MLNVKQSYPCAMLKSLSDIKFIINFYLGGTLGAGLDGAAAGDFTASSTGIAHMDDLNLDLFSSSFLESRVA